MRCCFAGHSNCDCGSEICKKLTSTIEKLITEENITEFYVGNYGDFDRTSASVLTKIKQTYPHIKIFLVIPYLTKSAEEKADRFDDLTIFEIPQSTPRKLKIIKTNEAMINHCDILVCYINRTWGGAIKTFQYAKRKNKTIINLADKSALQLNSPKACEAHLADRKVNLATQ